LRAMGYFPDLDAIKQSAEDANLDPQDSELDLSELWQLLQIYRAREGLNRQEAADINEAYRRYTSKKQEIGDESQAAEVAELSTLDIGKVLRWLGYVVPFEVQQSLTSQVDIDGSGKLDLGEFRKLIRMRRDQELEEMQRVFRVTDEDNEGVISPNEAKSAMRMLGVLGPDGVPPGVALEDMIPDPQNAGAPMVVDIFGFVRAVKVAMQVSKKAFRDNGGFSQVELFEMKAVFDRYDQDGSGDISNSELSTLIEHIFPEMCNDATLRPKLMEIMQEVDSDGSGSLDFQDFLRLMRTCREMQDRERILKEHKAVVDTLFSTTEVQEFRELFLATDDSNNGELSLPEFKRMIGSICPLGDKISAELTVLFRGITCKQKGVEGHRDQADFPEFLWLMRKLLDINFASIREKTGAHATAKEQEDVAMRAGA